MRSAQAQLAQARASLTQAEVNLQKTVITAPIDGIVIGRSVDVGQTVAASLQAPTLFTLAADLSEMQVNTNIDESDLGNVRDGQPVTFRVDAYPTRTFTGTVTQIRLDPVVSQNVVTYAAIISAPNPALELKPGMTANVTIEVARKRRCAAGAVGGAAVPSDRGDAGGARPGPEGAGAEPRPGRPRPAARTATARHGVDVRRPAAPDAGDDRRQRRRQHRSRSATRCTKAWCWRRGSPMRRAAKRQRASSSPLMPQQGAATILIASFSRL